MSNVTRPTNGDQLGPERASSALLADRFPPQNIEAEQGVLGSILLKSDVLHDVVPFLRVDDFFRDAHQVIYRAMLDLYELGSPVDLTTLRDELTRRGRLKAIGGMDYLAEILGSVPHAANGVYYAQIVRGKSITRKLVECGTRMIHDGYSNDFTHEELLEAAEREIFSIAEGQATGDTVTAAEGVASAWERIIARQESRHAVTGVASGYFDLDDLLGGFQPGQLIVLAARPSMGKSALALNIVEHVAIEGKLPTLFVSLEMEHVEISERLICALSGVDGDKLRRSRGLVSTDYGPLATAKEAIAAAPLFIDDTSSRSMLEILANARRLKRRHNLGLVVIDYVQLVAPDQSRDSRQEQVAKATRRLKTMARDLEVPVIALSQLNREVESREDHKPRLSDLRESGALEQDADVVLLLSRPDHYEATERPGEADLIVAKNRNGSTGLVRLTFKKNIARFENLGIPI